MNAVAAAAPLAAPARPPRAAPADAVLAPLAAAAVAAGALLAAPSSALALGAALAVSAASAASAYRLGRRGALPAADVLIDAADRIARGEAPGPLALPRGADPSCAALAASLRSVAARMEEERRRLRDVGGRAFRAQETERMRIAHELQDETAQTLSGLLLHLRVARTLPDAQAREAVLDEIRDSLSATTDMVRRFARGLYPPALEDLGVAAAVEAYASTLAESSGIAIAVRGGDVRGILSRDRELALYRIVQEALANAVRHAGAETITVALVREAGGVRAEVRDDGAGFDLARREAEQACLGLFGIRERAEYAGGRAEIRTAPGEGTRIVVHLPADDAARTGGRPAILPPPRAAGLAR